MLIDQLRSIRIILEEVLNSGANPPYISSKELDENDEKLERALNIVNDIIQSQRSLAEGFQPINILHKIFSYIADRLGSL